MAIPALLRGRFRTDSKDTFQGHDNGDVTVTQGGQAWHPRRDWDAADMDPSWNKAGSVSIGTYILSP